MTTEQQSSQPPAAQTPAPKDATTTSASSRRLSRFASPLIVIVLVAASFWLGGLVLGGSSSSEDHTGHTGAKAKKGQLWTCSMHPQIKLPKPGKCPICGMDLIPLDNGGGDSKHKTSNSTVVLTETAKKQAKIRTVLVTATTASADMELLGRLEVDETSIRTITPWTSGRLDRLLIHATGEKVKRGQAVGSLYSPEVLTAEQEYLIAVRQRKAMTGSIPVAERGAKAALSSSAERLRLLGFNDGELKRLEKRGKPSRNVAIISSYPGTVLKLLIHEGAYVQTGTPLLQIANLDKLWVQLDVYENDLPRVAKGQKVKLAIDGMPDETFQGVVTFIDPVLNPTLRTARVRVEVPNKDGRLRPGMFARAVVDTTLPKGKSKMKLSKGKKGSKASAAGSKTHAGMKMNHAASGAMPIVPASAVLFTGKRYVLYVEKPGTSEPTYELRTVRLGARSGDNYPVLSGVKIGERVVAQGAFAIDADLQLKGGQSMMAQDDDVARERISPIDLPKADLQKLAPMVDAYLAFTEALSKDDLGVARTALGRMAGAAGNVQLKAIGKPRKVWNDLQAQLLPAARQGSRATSLTEERNLLLALSRTMVLLMQRVGNPSSEPLRLAFCPMADNSRGALWLQRGQKIHNPYFGKEMFTCGSIRQLLKPSDRATKHAVRGKASTSKPAAQAGHNH